MIAREAERVALVLTLFAVLLILYMHVDHYIRHHHL